MFNSRSYYLMEGKRSEIVSKLDILNNQIKEISDQAKTLKKGSEERKIKMSEAQSIKNSYDYKVLNENLKLINFCINSLYIGGRPFGDR
ncbi:MAG: hypothetical protein ACLTDM_07130 [Clostridium butyricum]